MSASIIARWAPSHLVRSGSLYATSARDDARFCTIRCAALRILFSSGSIAKSFITISRVAIAAILAERSTIDWRMSRMALSVATVTMRFTFGLACAAARNAACAWADSASCSALGANWPRRTCHEGSPPARDEQRCNANPLLPANTTASSSVCTWPAGAAAAPGNMAEPPARLAAARERSNLSPAAPGGSRPAPAAAAGRAASAAARPWWRVLRMLDGSTVLMSILSPLSSTSISNLRLSRRSAV